jgi:hypothetical protein
MTTNLFHSTSTSGTYNITVDILLLSNNTVELTFRGTPQFITYLTYFNKDPCFGCIINIDTTGIFTVNLGAYNMEYHYTNFYYIYALKTRHFAEAVQKILPPTKFRLELLISNEVFMIYVTEKNETRVINYGQKTKTLIAAVKHTLEPGEMKVLLGTSHHYITVRSDSDCKGLSYTNLTDDEKSTLVPDVVQRGLTLTTNCSTVHDWHHINTCLYKGTLTYVETLDTYIHMIDDKGNKYKYNMETYRSLIPKMVNGSVSGTFQYAARGNRNINYILVPCSTTTKSSAAEDLVLCESDSSGEE